MIRMTQGATTDKVYRGRFAPSPTGPLHFGSLVAALGSYLDARHHGGAWLVRMEDVDASRNVPGAADDILRTLEVFGFAWDEPVLYQLDRLAAYEMALSSLRERGLAYGCACSRKAIAEAAHQSAIDGGLLYPGTCRGGLSSGQAARAWRLRVDASTVSFEDRLQGLQEQQLARCVGDFVLHRADGLYAYQLAVTVDDAFQGISDVVRGADLLDSTPRQIWLQACLGLPTVRYAHLPVATNAAGEKLSKQTLAPALPKDRAADYLVAALGFLGQQVPSDLVRSSLAEVWAWAFANWSFDQVPHCRSMVLPAALHPPASAWGHSP